MGTKYIRTISSKWILLYLVTIGTISQSNVEGLPTLDKTIFGPKLKGTIKTIEALEVGDIIDCVDIYKQPAFDNSLIKDLKMPPIYSTSINKTSNHGPLFIQPWTKFGECPKGTIPIRRTLDNNVTIHRKYSNDRRNHEYATVVHYFNKGRSGRGGRGNFNTWTPRLMAQQEFSSSQLWVVSGRGASLETAEAGWMVQPNLFHDAQARLFISWSRDNYDTWCFNTMCEEGEVGFVQTDDTVILGGAVSTTSEYNGEQHAINIGLTRNEDGDWWVQIGDRLVGYFPRQLFNNLGGGADSIAFGGEIKNIATGGRHTSTAMGSGHFSAEGFTRACFIRNILVKNHNFEWVEPHLQVQQVSRPTCYDLTFGQPTPNFGSHFFFGGPGFSQQCQ